MSPYPRRVYATTLLMVTGFTFLSRLTQIAPPSPRFVSLGAGVRLGLPSHPASRRRSCLRLGVSTTSSSRGPPPPINRPCRAYSRHRLRRREFTSRRNPSGRPTGTTTLRAALAGRARSRPGRPANEHQPRARRPALARTPRRRGRRMPLDRSPVQPNCRHPPPRTLTGR
jgi:hypothetical protein